MFEKNDSNAPKPKPLSVKSKKGSGTSKREADFISLLPDIFPDIKKIKIKTSNSDNKSSSSDVERKMFMGNLLHSGYGFHKRDSTSTDDKSLTPVANTSSSQGTRTTPSSTISSGKPVFRLHPTQQSTVLKPPKFTIFRRSADEIISERSDDIPEILEVFTDLDQFIDSELSELNTHNRVQQKLDEIDAFDVFSKLKIEFYRDKLQHQQEFEVQLKKQRMSDSIEEDDENEENEGSSILNLSDASQKNHLRQEKIKKLKLETKKQEYILDKINRVLENITTVDERNIDAVIKIERHYLVASSRFQSALTELQRLNKSSAEFHPHPFNRRGKIIVSEVMLEVKESYFERPADIFNEYVVVVLKHDEEIYATQAVSISDDIRTIRFPQTIRIPEAYLDFVIRMEVYGTTFWRERKMIRPTMLKKYGFTAFSLAQTGSKRQKFNLTEVIKSENNPLREKVLVKIRQQITVDVQFSGILYAKIGDSWVKTFAMLVGHLLEITLAEDDQNNPSDNMLLDLYNFDSDFAVPVLSNVAGRPFAFMLKFNHNVEGNDFQ